MVVVSSFSSKNSESSSKSSSSSIKAPNPLPNSLSSSSSSSKKEDPLPLTNFSLLIKSKRGWIGVDISILMSFFLVDFTWLTAGKTMRMSVAVTQSCNTGEFSKFSALGRSAKVEKAILVLPSSCKCESRHKGSCSLARLMETCLSFWKTALQSAE